MSNYTEYPVIPDLATEPANSGCPNYTGSKIEMLSNNEKLVAILLYSLVAVVATGGNAVVIFIVVYFRRMRTVTNMFIVNLAISDILMAAMCIPFSYWPVLILSSWPFGLFMCKALSFVKVLAVMLSAHTLVVISFDRFVAILRPMTKHMSWPIATAYLVLIWVVDVGIAFPVLIVQTVKNHTANNHTTIYCTEDWGVEVGGFIYSTLIMILQYFLPLFILVITYTGIGIRICLSSTPGEVDKQLDRRRRNIKRKAILMMFLVSTTYAVCWLPQNSLNVLHSFCMSYLGHPRIYYIWWGCHFSAMCQSCVNPFIYSATSERFREGFRYVFQWCPRVKYFPKELLTLQQARSASAKQSVTMSSNGRNKVKLLGDALMVGFTKNHLDGSSGLDILSNGGGGKNLKLNADDGHNFNCVDDIVLLKKSPSGSDSFGLEPSESDVLLLNISQNVDVTLNGLSKKSCDLKVPVNSAMAHNISSTSKHSDSGKVRKQVSFQDDTEE